jgi:hypothetical protein
MGRANANGTFDRAASCLALINAALEIDVCDNSSRPDHHSQVASLGFRQKSL